MSMHPPVFVQNGVIIDDHATSSSYTNKLQFGESYKKGSRARVIPGQFQRACVWVWLVGVLGWGDYVASSPGNPLRPLSMDSVL